MNASQKKRLCILFFGLNILLVLIHIHKQSLLVKWSFNEQRLEQQKILLIKQRNELLCQWQEVSSCNAIHNFAEKKLTMKPITMNQVKTISRYE